MGGLMWMEPNRLGIALGFESSHRQWSRAGLCFHGREGLSCVGGNARNHHWANINNKMRSCDYVIMY